MVVQSMAQQSVLHLHQLVRSNNQCFRYNSGDLTGDVTGNADTATQLANGRNFSIAGDITEAAVSFDGTGNVALNATIDDNAVALGTKTTGNYVATVADSGSGNLTVTGSGSETAAAALDLSDTGVSANSYGSTTAIPVLAIDAKGRITSASTASISTDLYCWW